MIVVETTEKIEEKQGQDPDFTRMVHVVCCDDDVALCGWRPKGPCLGQASAETTECVVCLDMFLLDVPCGVEGCADRWAGAV